jgi:hypothetical protein
MKINTSIQLIKKYVACPVCGNALLGNGNGALVIDDDRFVRSCRCGWHVELGPEGIKRFEESGEVMRPVSQAQNNTNNGRA